MIGQGIYRVLKGLVIKERSVNKLTVSFCLGVYIAFSPFIGFHTLMVFCFAWLLSLNPAVLLASTYLVNNPWTMVPVYTSGYVVGDWVLSCISSDIVSYNPHWMHWINDRLVYYVGIKGISLWAFLIGGNILGVVFGIVCYPVMKKIFERLVAQGYVS